MGQGFYDDFNGYTLTQAPPAPWVTLQPTTGQVEVTSDPAVGAPQGRVVRLFDDSTSSRAQVHRPCGVTSTKVTFDLKFYAAQTDKRLALGYWQSGAGRSALWIDSNGFIRVNDDQNAGAGDINIAAYTANTWHSLSYTVDTVGNWLRDVIFNGTKVLGSHFIQFGFVGASANIEEFWAGTDQSFAAQTFFIDDVRTATFLNTVSGIVRDRRSGVPISGATVYVMRQSDQVVVGKGTSSGTGTFSITDVISPNQLPHVVEAYRNAGDLGSGRPHVEIF